MKIIDSHCHTNFQMFEPDADQIIEETLGQGIQMIVVGTDLKTSQRAIEQANRHEGVFASIGLHPVHVFDRDIEREMKEIGKLVGGKKVVAVGEVGFDLFRLKFEEKKTIELQKKVFEFFIDLAAKNNKPVIIHNREAWKILVDYLPTIKKNNLKGVQHCFPEGIEEARQLFEIGFKIGFTGMITYNDKWDAIIPKIPLDQILIETDAPFLTPGPNRRVRNVPANVRQVGEHIARLKNNSEEEVFNQTYQNAADLFNLKGKTNV